MNIDSKFIVQLQGKQFVTYEGLLDLAHQLGLKSIKTELVSVNGDSVVFKATAKTEEKEFDGYGDADGSNVNKMIAKHKLRMAETRAKARALRDLTNIGMCAVEELGGDDSELTRKQSSSGKQTLTDAQRKELQSLAEKHEVKPEQVQWLMKEHYSVNMSKDLPVEHFDELKALIADYHEEAV